MPIYGEDDQDHTVLDDIDPIDTDGAKEDIRTLRALIKYMVVEAGTMSIYTDLSHDIEVAAGELTIKCNEIERLWELV